MNRMDGAPLLQLDGVSLRRGGEWTLRGVDMVVREKEIVTLVGPNGAGKTSLVRAALGLIKPDDGKVLLHPGVRIGYMPQNFSIDPTLPLTVRAFLALVGRVSAQDIAAALEGVRANHLQNSPMHGLSGGELQRVLLARAVLRRPSLLVLDEPVRGVDVGGQAELYELIGRLRDQLGCGVLMVSHDLHLVMAATDHVLCLNRHVCCEGHPETVTRHPEYVALFGPRLAESMAVYTHRHDHAHDLHGDVHDQACETHEHNHG